MSVPALPEAQAVSTDPGLFGAAVKGAYLQAEAAAGAVRHTFAVGGHDIELRLAGPALLPVLWPAFSHLASAKTGPDTLTICAWDSVSTGIPIPPAPWPASAYALPRGDISGYNDERFQVSFQVDAQVLCVLDNEAGLAFFWAPEAANVPYYENGAPLRNILHWWLGQFGCQLVHAAAVGTKDGAVLLAGKGGSGKSTTALACLMGGLHYLGDDYVVVAAEPQPYVHSLYNSAKLDPEALRVLPSLAGRVQREARSRQEKALFFLQRDFPERIRASSPLRAILLPRVTGERHTRLERTTAAHVLASLAVSTIFQLPGAGQQDLRMLACLAAGMPCYLLALGTDLSAIPEAIASLLSPGPGQG